MHSKQRCPNSSRAAALLKRELRNYERSGTRLYLEGRPSHAEKIVSACMFAEGSGYMRDFIGDDQEVIRGINFVRICL